ncbi:MAG: hypothetical protein NW237_00185 [Cyanobacteriota bacterium]|nr:hypothetical protein [Cyanobacteriota bacterium]
MSSSPRDKIMVDKTLREQSQQYVKFALPELVLKELFVEPLIIQERLGLSIRTLQILRREGSLIQGIHFSEINTRLIVYNLPLMIDWVANRHDPDAHIKAIENFQASLLSNRSRRRG